MLFVLVFLRNDFGSHLAGVTTMSELHELTRKLDHLQKQITNLELRLAEQHAASRDLAQEQFRALLAAMGRSNAETELAIVKNIVSVAEQMSALRARLQ